MDLAPLRVALVAFPGTPSHGTAADELARQAIDVLSHEPRVLDGAPPDRPLVLLWTPAGMTASIAQAAVAWCARAPGPPALLGCAAGGANADAERALAAGFDDFVAGRAGHRELAARLRALSRRASPRRADRLRAGRLLVDLGRHEASVAGGPERVPMTPAEVMVLAALARGRTLARDELLDHVWGADDLEVGLRAVDNLVARLRKKLDPRLIVTVRGVGFRLGD